MPFLSRGQCHSTELQAAQSHCSSIVEGPATNTILVCTGASVSGGNALLTISQFSVSTSAQSSRTISVPLQPCDPEFAPTPFDYVYASGLWSLAFTFVLGLYLISKKAGLILSLIRGY